MSWCWLCLVPLSHGRHQKQRVRLMVSYFWVCTWTCFLRAVWNCSDKTNYIYKLQIRWSVFYQHNMRLMNILAILMTVTTLFWLTCLPAKISLQEWQIIWDISLDIFSFYQAASSIRHIYQTNKFIINGLDSLKDPPDYWAREKWLDLL